MANFADNYVSVAERIDEFLRKHPDGRIQTEIAKHTDTVVIMRATVYRSPEDTCPSVAHSQLGIPGKTNFTRDSEVENAETSAVGRALAFMGFETKRGIASQEEVQSRHADHETGEVATKAAPKRDWTGTQLKALLEGNDLVMLDLTPVLETTVTRENYGFAIDAYLMGHPGEDLATIIGKAARIKQGEKVGATA